MRAISGSSSFRQNESRDPLKTYSSLVVAVANPEPARDHADQLTRPHPSTRRDYWASDYPTKRFTLPEEIAELCLFLCSDRAANITGASHTIDGGLMAVLPERS